MNCRIDSNTVGHFFLSLRTKEKGRARNPKLGKFFDENGDVKSFTLTGGIDSISPVEGSNEGGTMITISGQGFHRTGDLTEVLVGGDPCEIKTIDPYQITCLTQKPSFDTRKKALTARV